MTVALLGASQTPSRYSYMAQKNLMQEGYSVIPVTPKYSEVLEVSAVDSLSKIGVKVDTLTIYISPEKLDNQLQAILELSPRRAIFNPGTESSAVEAALREAGIETERACTLVLLRTGQFEN